MLKRCPMLNTINPQNLSLSAAQWTALGPYVIVTLGILASMVLSTVNFGKNASRFPLFLFSMAVMTGACVWTGIHWAHEPMPLFGGMMVVDYFSSFFNMLLCGATALVMLGSYSYLEE